MFKSFAARVALCALATVMSACASVNSVSLTPIPSNRSREVRAEVERTIFLAFNFDNDYIDPLVQELKRQCPNGVVSGILTKDETIAYVIVFKRKVTATGFCNSSVAKNNKAGRSTASESEN
jgi:hypothetical protein